MPTYERITLRPEDSATPSLTAVPERPFRQPGCDDRCTVIRAVVTGVFGRSELLLHDPEAHEEYGSALAATSSPLAHTVVTGPLAVNLSSLVTTVNGEPISLTVTETRLLGYLARRIGQAVTHADALRQIWGAGCGPDSVHLLRVTVCRLRGKLGPARSLIATVFGVGLRLELVPPEGAQP